MSRRYVPAAGHDLLLPLYDPLWKLIGGERLRAGFIRDASLAPGQRILDIGCGTGSLAVQIATSVPGTEVTGLDPDPKALARGAQKAAAARVAVRFIEGFADDLPFEDGAFERVVSSFMFHHLDPDVKLGMLAEARRVLAPEGELHLIDFGHSGAETDGFLARLLHSHENIHDNLATERFEQAGFAAVSRVGEAKSLFGRYTHLQAGAA